MTEITVCIVSLDCRQVLQDCLESLAAAEPVPSHEVIVVDNGSRDGTAEMVRSRFPGVRLITNSGNVGFTRATNQAIAAGSGRYILWLNPDTLVRPDSLRRLWEFLETNPRVGIAGPKVLNPDGTFQPQCRRGLPTPLASLAYLLGLHRLWPRNRNLGGYLLTYIPADQSHAVDAVSGACLLARRAVWGDIGPLDDEIFGFGEDLEWCVRAKKAGWEVWYQPGSVIVHLKGQGGSQSRPYRKVWSMHQAMRVIYRKHLRAEYSWPTNALVGAGIAGSLVVSSLAVALRRFSGRVRRSAVLE